MRIKSWTEPFIPKQGVKKLQGFLNLTAIDKLIQITNEWSPEFDVLGLSDFY